MVLRTRALLRGSLRNSAAKAGSSKRLAQISVAAVAALPVRKMRDICVELLNLRNHSDWDFDTHDAIERGNEFIDGKIVTRGRTMARGCRSR